MTPQEFEERMKFIDENEDTEDAHENADKLMCAVLRELGYSAGVAIFEKMTKWYA